MRRLQTTHLGRDCRAPRPTVRPERRGRTDTVRPMLAELDAMEREALAELGAVHDAAQLEALAAPMLKNSYGQYLMQVLRERAF